MATGECPVCKKSFKNESALAQHRRDKAKCRVVPKASSAPVPAPPPPAPPSTRSSTMTSSSTPAASSSKPSQTVLYCSHCLKAFGDKTSLDMHVTSKHTPKPFKCAPCSLDFISAESLGLHYRHSATHPKCPQCGSAFLDQPQLVLHQAIHPKCTQCGAIFLSRSHMEEHVAVAHPPMLQCTPCGREFKTAAERKKHYQTSSNHPVCFVCGEGFVDDVEVESHMSRAHLNARCRLCNRQFRSVEDLQGHYLVSPAHPHCALCEIGFPNEMECDEHMEVNHPRPLRLPTPPPPAETPPPLPHTIIPTVTVEPSSFESQITSQSTQSSPLIQRPSMNGVSASTSMAAVRDESDGDDDDDDDDTYQTVEASSHIQRAISEPTVPTVSSIGYDSVHDETTQAWRSPTISESSVDYINLRGMARHPQSESTMSLQSAPSTVSSESPVQAEDHASPNVPDPSLNFVPHPFDTPNPHPRTESIISQNVSPRVHSPILSTRSFSSLSEHLARNVAPVLRPSLSRQPTPRIPSPVLSPRSASRSSMMHAPVPASAAGGGAERSVSSRKSSKAPTIAALSSDTETEETVPGPQETPKPIHKDIPFPMPKPKAMWHCRICKADPCILPAATLCGHIFCTSCIVQELVKTGSCPVCKKMLLLRLHVEQE